MAGLAYLHWGSPIDRAWAVAALSNAYRGEIGLQSFHSSLFPRIDVGGTGLSIRRRDQPALPPLATVAGFEGRARWFELLSEPRHFRSLTLRGLVVNVPPASVAPAPPPAATGGRHRRTPSFVLGAIDADGTVIRILSNHPDKPPLEFNIARLRLKGVGANRPFDFDAILTNPKPVGQVVTHGQFGPWHADVPGQTPLSGTYTFRDADLSTIRGLVGMLSSQGRFDGILDRIAVHGSTKTPDFSLGLGGKSMELDTTFAAVVDGTSGDTYLDPVQAMLANSPITARGSVVSVHTLKASGKRIMLDVSTDSARLQDLLHLGLKTEPPPLVGLLKLRAKMRIDPGDADLLQRLGLAGSFTVNSARFTDPDTESKLAEMSWRGSARPKSGPNESTTFTMGGAFVLDGAVLNLSELRFAVPGAVVQLHGRYGLRDESLDFDGTVALQARLSQTISGFKSLLVRPFNPLFKGDGGNTEFPIHIGGTRSQPIFKVEIGKKLRFLP